MGWNDARVTLVAPGWRVVSEDSCPPRRTAKGLPLRIRRIERVRTDSEAIRASEVIEWLQIRGFSLVEQSHSSLTLKQKDIEAFLAVDDSDMSEMIVTFQLTPDAPKRWVSWKEFVVSCSNGWDLSLYDPRQRVIVDSSEVFRLLSETEAWQDFAVHYQWPLPFTGFGMNGGMRGKE
jgi:hypothetical protein